jgi:hypothetical protein
MGHDVRDVSNAGKGEPMGSVGNISDKVQPFQLEACPHCGANTDLSNHVVYRYQCRLCGGARIPVNRNVTRTPAEVTALLKRVRTRHIARGAWKAAANTLWVMAVFVALLGLGLSRAFDFGVAGITLVSLFTLLPIIIGGLSKRASGKAAQASKTALTEAWSMMATHVCASLGGKYSVEDLKAAFGVDTDSALALVAEAEVAEFLQGNTQSSAPFDARRVRIAETPTGEDDADARALEALRKELEHK